MSVLPNTTWVRESKKTSLGLKAKKRRKKKKREKEEDGATNPEFTQLARRVLKGVKGVKIQTTIFGWRGKQKKIREGGGFCGVHMGSPCTRHPSWTRALSKSTTDRKSQTVIAGFARRHQKK